MKTNVIISLQMEGLHRWQGCNIREVIFLINSHRHIFYITCKKAVSHNDRDIEIICTKRDIQKYLLNKYSSDGITCDFGSMSCEMIAEELVKEFDLSYCSVMEDNENGAEVTL